jgi:hypothetical protein
LAGQRKRKEEGKRKKEEEESRERSTDLGAKGNAT